jgi:hypothetical protein
MAAIGKQYKVEPGGHPPASLPPAGGDTLLVSKANGLETDEVAIASLNGSQRICLALSDAGVPLAGFALPGVYGRGKEDTHSQHNHKQ